MAVSNATLLAKISALEARITALAAKVKSDEASLRPLIVAGATQGTFLASLSQMTTPGEYPLDPDPNSGGTFVSGERDDYINPPINLDNSLIQKLQRNGYMAP